MLKCTKKNFCQLKEKLQKVIPNKLQEFKKIKNNYSNHKIGNINIGQTLRGMKGVTGLLYETSKLDPDHGIYFRNMQLIKLVEKLKYQGSQEPLPEALIWFLFTGEIPSEEETKSVIDSLNQRSKISDETINLINSLPKDMNPITQLSLSVLSLQKYSVFPKANSNQINKCQDWEYYYEDSMNLIAKLPVVAAMIYNNLYRNGELKHTEKGAQGGHMAENFAQMLGFNNKDFINLLCNYLVLYSDYSGGNVSAHAVQLVGSALSDPYHSYSAGLNGLAGPLHGPGNQDILKWYIQCQSIEGNYPTDIQIEKYVRDSLKEKNIIPGYGNGKQKRFDPRHVLLMKFGDKYLPNFFLFKLVKQCDKIIPKILKEVKKKKHPMPTVDCSSGVLLYYYGLKEFDFYKVMLGVSRAIGTLSNLTWSRIYELPVEKAQSITLDKIRSRVKN